MSEKIRSTYIKEIIIRSDDGKTVPSRNAAGVTENQKEELMQNDINCAKSAADEARERVEEELSDLCEKMSKLTVFLYGEGRVKANLSDKMIKLMARQLDIMKSYATTLQTRLSIWGKSNKELESLYNGDDNT